MTVFTHNDSEAMRILVIDDSPSDSAMISAWLGNAGHQVHCASNSQEGIAHLLQRDNDTDLILLDVLMPGTDGLETAQQIRALEDAQGLQWRPIIFLSGRVEAEDIAAGIFCGGDDYISKPIELMVLKAKMHAMQRIAKMRKQLINVQQRLEKEANTDTLTGLANRRHFMSVLNKEVARALRHQTPLALAYLDLDFFKRINDTYGHQAGDAVLKATTHYLSQSVREIDLIGRIGGEEFCLCMPGASLHQASLACERYRKGLQQLIVDTPPHQLQVTASFGITEFTGNDDVEQLMARADNALYQAKNNGRNRIICFGGILDMEAS